MNSLSYQQLGWFWQENVDSAPLHLNSKNICEGCPADQQQQQQQQQSLNNQASITNENNETEPVTTSLPQIPNLPISPVLLVTNQVVHQPSVISPTQTYKNESDTCHQSLRKKADTKLSDTLDQAKVEPLKKFSQLSSLHETQLQQLITLFTG